MRWNFNTEIAGVYYRRNNLESGRFSGYIKKDLNNPVDPEAIGVYLNNGTLVGYIPKDQIFFLKAWNPNFNNSRAEIKLNIEHEWDRYYGTVSVKSNDTYNNSNPLRGKKIYVCKDIKGDSDSPLMSIAATFGVIFNTPLKLDTDFVVHGDSIPKTVLDKIEGGNYHFELLPVTKFIKMGLSPEECDKRFYGKTIYARNKEYGSYIRHIRNYILENGGCIVDVFSKQCDVALDWGNGFAPTITQRIERYNITVISASSILAKPIINTLSTTTSPNVGVNTITPNSIFVKPVEKNSKNNDTNFNSNSVLFIILAIAVILIILILLPGLLS